MTRTPLTQTLSWPIVHLARVAQTDGPRDSYLPPCTYDLLGVSRDDGSRLGVVGSSYWRRNALQIVRLSRAFLAPTPDTGNNLSVHTPPRGDVHRISAGTDPRRTIPAERPRAVFRRDGNWGDYPTRVFMTILGVRSLHISFNDQDRDIDCPQYC